MADKSLPLFPPTIDEKEAEEPVLEPQSEPSDTELPVEPAAKDPRPVSSDTASLHFNLNPLAPYKGVVRRFFLVYRHVMGLLLGGNVAYVRTLPPHRRRRLRSPLPRLTAFFMRPFVRRDVVDLPFPQQLRRRLEMLGPTYVKLGQIMAIREDLLPAPVTTELRNLFDRLPSVPFSQVTEIIESSLHRPLDSSFEYVEPEPLGSASIAQAHLARLKSGEQVVLKVIKPGIREAILSDLKLLQIFGRFIQWIIPRYQIRLIIEEFCTYTRKEIDFTYEADHAEMFAANFHGNDDIVFPRIYRDLSSQDVLTMSFLEGFQPGSPPTDTLTDVERARIIDLGALSIIQMLYGDGFFHADLHAGNLMILPGDPVRLGFIDLGMVGRFEEKTRRSMLYYFHALVNNDVEGATRYIADMARVGKGGDPNGFRRAVADMSRRFIMHSNTGEFSIAQMILQSINLGGRYRIFFPVEMTLMVKALVTFEGVGRMLDPELDIPTVTRKHVSRIFREQLNPAVLAQALARSTPEMVDLVVQLPRLLSAGYRHLEMRFDGQPPTNPMAGLRGSIVSGASIVGGVLALLMGGPWYLWSGLFVVAVLLYFFGK